MQVFVYFFKLKFEMYVYVSPCIHQIALATVIHQKSMSWMSEVLTMNHFIK